MVLQIFTLLGEKKLIHATTRLDTCLPLQAIIMPSYDAIHALNQDCENIIAFYKDSFPNSTYLSDAKFVKEKIHFARFYVEHCPDAHCVINIIKEIKGWNYMAGPKTADYDVTVHGPRENFCFPLLREAMVAEGEDDCEGKRSDYVVFPIIRFKTSSG